MFREIRKKKNEIGLEEVKRLLVRERRGVLSVNGENGYPYAVPINYWFCEETEKIYFHGARIGYKVDAIRKCDKVCFTVFGNESVQGESWAPYVQSVVVFGKCRLIENQEVRREFIEKFARKYYPNERSVQEEIARSGKAVQMFEIEIEHWSGKQIQEK